MGEVDGATGLAARLGDRYRGLEGEDLLAPLIEREFPGRIALLSSFGSEAALLLDMVARIDRSVPVVFLDTGKLFGETLRYRDQLVRRLGLTDLRVVRPDPVQVERRDAAGDLWLRDADACCALRKVEPLRAALAGFAACISGRKRYQGGRRTGLAAIEAAEGRVKVNPLAGWSRDRILDAFAARDLPPHPLEADGFLSIGCMPCTDRVAPGADPRSGRWAGRAKTECGIHL
ncbi:MAG: phosphoadenylyl-sulfate reductase [Dongiaceae bacterium]